MECGCRVPAGGEVLELVDGGLVLAAWVLVGVGVVLFVGVSLAISHGCGDVLFL